MSIGIVVLLFALVGGVLTGISGYSKGRWTARFGTASALAAIIGAFLTYRYPTSTTTTILPDVPGPTATRLVVSPQLRDAIERYAMRAGPHKLLVLTVDNTDAITYGDAIAKAFKESGWTIDGLGPNGLGPGGHVMRRLGALLPDDPEFAVAALDPKLAVGLHSVFEQNGMKATSSWPPNEPPLKSEVGIFVGKAVP